MMSSNPKHMLLNCMIFKFSTKHANWNASNLATLRWEIQRDTHTIKHSTGIIHTISTGGLI